MRRDSGSDIEDRERVMIQAETTHQVPIDHDCHVDVQSRLPSYLGHSALMCLDFQYPTLNSLPRSTKRFQGINCSMASLLDSQCPSCEKRFPNDSLVLRHMNNPLTSCASWFDYLKSISSTQSHHPTDRRTSSPTETNDLEATGHEEPTSNPRASAPPRYEDIHPNAPSVFGSGPGFMDAFNADRHAEARSQNLYYPFSSKEEWGLSSWLLCSGLSMRAIDEFLALPIVSPPIHGFFIADLRTQVRQLSLSFATAKTLRNRMEDLPKAPEWKMQDISITGYETVKPIVVFYRDPLECIQYLLRNPIFEGKWDFVPRRIYDSPDRQNRVYGEWMTSDGAWAAQVSIFWTFPFTLVSLQSVHSPAGRNTSWRGTLLRQNQHLSCNG